METSKKKLEMYLHSIDWNKKEFNDKQLEAMLAASCLRFLAGIEELPFVLELSREISRQYRATMNLSMQYSTEVLNDLYEKMQQKEIQLNDAKKIMEIIDEAQEVLTGRKYNP